MFYVQSRCCMIAAGSGFQHSKLDNHRPVICSNPRFFPFGDRVLMVTLFFLVIVGGFFLCIIAIGAFRLIKKSPELKLFQGAAFWLSGAFLVAIFAIFGFLWGQF